MWLKLELQLVRGWGKNCNKFVYLKHYDFCYIVPPTNDGSSSNVLVIGLVALLGIAFVVIISLLCIVLCACIYMKNINTDGLDR